ncbi:putative ribosomal protein/carboxylic ester hydrolase [Talaromyces proteolyticus]|uniref:Protein phosphatase methylesterase 1 n=1 Tax=Talaromyces proteolyticus TaxID=1131652 RepID=A0AAD4KZ15_9EURO|nr:putative ribosomal protein/carboxylic ester hydrolase [Talaromyces proteolyticus]KAH8700676.1 putative ribosomal protein/carboxylic ester hydrolase [Talaromyces proteolyticus]
MDNMSDLQKSFVKARLAKLPPDLPFLNESDENSKFGSTAEEDGDSSSTSSASSNATIMPSPSKGLFFKQASTGSSRKDPSKSLSWSEFYSQELFLEEDVDDLHIVHHAYITPPSKSGPLFVTHHGAGSSGLSFAACATEIRKILPDAGILSFDARHHGSTTVQSSSGEAKAPNYKLDTLSRDVVFVVRETQVKMGWQELPDIVLVGHSLGGAVITDVAKNGKLGSKVLAYAVLDVVEGSAMDALQSMDTYLSTRPTKFASLSSAIDWHIRSRTIRNNISARVSVPSLLKEEEDPSDPSRPWVWRTNLAETKPFWEDWFIGLSRKFLEAKGGKLLILAGTDRLDKELLIAQMQGKYSLQVLPSAGHFVQEDQPAKTAGFLVDLFKRNDRGSLVLPPKVGDILAARAMEKGVNQ